MQHPLSVSALNSQIKALLESTFLHVRVEGEVSRPTYHASGHLYFTLKDESSTISCVMFRGNNQKLAFRVEEGMHLVIWGSVSVYAPRGNYQINCFGAEPSGSGALALAYEQLKRDLEAKGYFDLSRKKPLPPFPKRVTLITSGTGAALEDMKHVASKRWPLVTLVIIDTLVQGKEAAPSIVSSLKRAHEVETDIIVLARGGGSVEDLWAFNELIVAEAVASAKLPIVSAIGHEIDYVITDFVADKRAPTPSAALELILPDQNEMRISIDYLLDSLGQRMSERLSHHSQHLKHLKEALSHHSLETKIDYKIEEIDSLKATINRNFLHKIERFGFDLKTIKERLEGAIFQLVAKKQSDLEVLESSYKAKSSMLEPRIGFAQLVLKNKPAQVNDLNINDEVQIQTTKVVLEAKITKKRLL